MTDFDSDHQLPAVQQPKQQSLSLYRQLMPDREADMMRAQCMSGGEWEYGKWLMLNPPSNAVKDRLQKRHRDIATNLSHHDQHAIAAAVSDAMACYRNFIKAGENPEKVVAKYVKELNGIPTWACVRACDAIRHNQAPGISLEFPFSTMQLRAIAEGYIKRLQDEAREISQIMLGGVLPPPASPEVRAKVARNMARLAFKMRGDRKREDDAVLKPMLARMKTETDDTIIREYRHKGEAPVFASGNVLVSPQLLAMTNEWRVRNANAMVQATGEQMRQHLAHKAFRVRIAKVAEERKKMKEMAALAKASQSIKSINATNKGILSLELYSWHLRNGQDSEQIKKQIAATGMSFMRRALKLVASKEEVTPNDILSPRRSQNIVMARFIFINICLELTGFSLPRIGRFLNRDHTTILSGRDRIIERMAILPELRERVEGYKEALRPHAPKSQATEPIEAAQDGWQLVQASHA